MPVIIMKTGITKPEVKKELIERLTRTAVDVTKIPSSSFTIFIEEYDRDSIGFDGRALSDKIASK